MMLRIMLAALLAVSVSAYGIPCKQLCPDNCFSLTCIQYEDAVCVQDTCTCEVSWTLDGENVTAECEIDNIDDDLEDLEDDIELEDDLEAIEDDLAELEDAIEAIEDDIEAIEDDIEAMEDDLELMEDDIDNDLDNDVEEDDDDVVVVDEDDDDDDDGVDMKGNKKRKMWKLKKKQKKQAWKNKMGKHKKNAAGKPKRFLIPNIRNEEKRLMLLKKWAIKGLTAKVEKFKAKWAKKDEKRENRKERRQERKQAMTPTEIEE